MRMAHSDPSTRAAASNLFMNWVARGSDARWRWPPGDFENVCAPEAPGSIYREVARVLHYRRTDQSIDEYTAQLYLLRRKSEPEMEMGERLPESSDSLLRMRNAAFTRLDKPSAIASTQKSLKVMDAAATMRRLF